VNLSPRSPRGAITEALEDAWLTADPSRPFDPDDVADRVQAYLDHSGYAITPRVRRRAPRRSRTGTAVLVSCWLSGILGAAVHASHGQWVDTAGSAVLTFLAAAALVRDYNPNRRNAR
jgi:hypothetical protein